MYRPFRTAIRLTFTCSLLVAACGSSPPDTLDPDPPDNNPPVTDPPVTDPPVTDPPTPTGEVTFRVRADASAPLNADAGWAAPAGESATVFADRPFRIRFEVEGASGEAATFRLQYRRNEGNWTNVRAADFPDPDVDETPGVSVVSASGYSGGATTTDLLPGSDLPFLEGAGVSFTTGTPSWNGQGRHGEWEWPIVIRKFADNAIMNEDGDTFDFRMVDLAGQPVGPAAGARVHLEVPAGLVGGTFPETPGRLGPWQASNGDLYFTIEPAETDNVLMVVKSTDGGVSWREVDGSSRPDEDDLEGFATVFHDGWIHMLHQPTADVFHHAFRTSEVPAVSDSWAITDDEIAEPSRPETQSAVIAATDDGRLVAVYADATGLRYRVRAAGGGWGSERVVDGPAGARLTGPQVVAGSGNVVFLAYAAASGSNGTVWARRIEPDGSLGTAVRVAEGIGTDEEDDAGPILPLAFLPETGQAVIIYRLDSGYLEERRMDGNGTLTAQVRVADRRVVQNAEDSGQVGADAIAINGSVHVLFIADDDRDIHYVRAGTSGGWSSPVTVVQNVNAQWVRGAAIRRADDSLVYGFVYDAGSDGGSGMNWYAEVPVSSP